MCKPTYAMQFTSFSNCPNCAAPDTEFETEGIEQSWDGKTITVETYCSLCETGWVEEFEQTKEPAIDNTLTKEIEK